MSIRVPPKADTETRDAFTDIEQELNDLKSSLVTLEDASPVSLESLQEEIALLNSKINQMSQFQDVTESYGTKTDGLPLRALHEDGNWKEVIDGLVKAVPAELGGASKAQRVVNVLASLAVINALSADTVTCRQLNFGSTSSIQAIRGARWAATAVDTSRMVWGTEDFNDDAVLYTLADSNARVTVAESGLYLVMSNGYTHGATLNAGYTHYIRQNETNILRSGSHSGNTGGHVVSSIGGLASASAADYFDVYNSTTSTASITFSIAKLA